jgi:hypothetical protein
MADVDAVAVSRLESASPSWRFFRVVPGVLLLAVVGYGGKFIEQFVSSQARVRHWTIPNIEYVL